VGSAKGRDNAAALIVNPTLDDYDKVAVEIHAVPVFQAVINEGARETLDVAAADTLYLRRHGQLSVAQYNTAIILRDVVPHSAPARLAYAQLEPDC